MDKPISVGDLVQVVRCCCNGTTTVLGKIGTVERTASYPDGMWKCFHCQSSGTNDPRVYTTGGFGFVPLSWLKRIPPIEELDNVKQDEEIHA